MMPDSVGKLFNLSFLLDYQVFGLPTITTKIVYQYLRQLDISGMERSGFPETLI
jgi:hypothetical protein